MDKLRGNLDYLYGREPMIVWGTEANAGNLDPLTVTLDDTMEWRDKVIDYDIVYGMSSAATVAEHCHLLKATTQIVEITTALIIHHLSMNRQSMCHQNMIQIPPRIGLIQNLTIKEKICQD
jgi:hypothetical protein